MILPEWLRKQIQSEVYFAVDAELLRGGIEEEADGDKVDILMNAVEEEVKKELADLVDLAMTEIIGTYFV